MQGVEKIIQCGRSSAVGLCLYWVDLRPSLTTANRHTNLWPNLVQITQCRVAAPAESKRWLVILRATG